MAYKKERLPRSKTSSGEGENKRGRFSSVLTVFNQPITLFLLGTVIVGTGTSYFAEMRQCVADWRTLDSDHRRLVGELQFRSTNLFLEAGDPAAGVPSRLERMRLWLSPRAPSLYREFAGERFHSLVVRMMDMHDRLEMERNLDSLTIEYASDVPADRFGPMPGYDEIYPPGAVPDRSTIQGLATLLSLAGQSEEDVLAAITGPRGEAVAQQLSIWLDALATQEVTRLRGGCGSSVIFQRLWNPRLQVARAVQREVQHAERS